MTENVARKMEDLPVFPLGSEKSGSAGGEERITSLEIASLIGKPHNDVMKAIRKMENAWLKVCKGKFSLSSKMVEMPNGGVREQPYYSLTKRESLYIATKFNDEARAKLVLRWEELENKERASVVSLPDFTNPAIAARAWADQFEKNQVLTLENRKQREELDKASQEIVELSATITQSKPKTTYFDVMMKNKSTSVITSTAQDYGMSAKSFNKLLNEMGIQHKVAGQWVLYRQYLDKGYVSSEPVTITHNDGTQTIKYISKWTQKGRYFLYEFLKGKGILPLIERCEAHGK